MVAGDLFHSPSGLTPEILDAVEDWLRTIGIPVTLVPGNHDLKLARLPEPLTTSPRLEIDGVDIVHDPADARGNRPTLCGHLHPVARIADGRRTALRLPCFHLTGRHLVLPAFGSFTGGRIVAAGPGDRLFVAPGGKVLEVPAGLWR